MVENITVILASVLPIFTAIVAAGVVISKFTDTDKDDKFFARCKEVLTSVFTKNV